MYLWGENSQSPKAPLKLRHYGVLQMYWGVSEKSKRKDAEKGCAHFCWESGAEPQKIFEIYVCTDAILSIFLCLLVTVSSLKSANLVVIKFWVSYLKGTPIVKCWDVWTWRHRDVFRGFAPAPLWRWKMHYFLMWQKLCAKIWTLLKMYTWNAPPVFPPF